MGHCTKKCLCLGCPQSVIEGRHLNTCVYLFLKQVCKNKLARAFKSVVWVCDHVYANARACVCVCPWVDALGLISIAGWNGKSACNVCYVLAIATLWNTWLCKIVFMYTHTHKHTHIDVIHYSLVQWATKKRMWCNFSSQVMLQRPGPVCFLAVLTQYKQVVISEFQIV